MNVKILRTITHINEKLWDSIIESNCITKTYRFLLSVEQSMINDNKFWYFLFYNENELIGHACAFTHCTNLEDTWKTPIGKQMIDRIRKRRKNFLRLKILGCGTPIATCSNELTVKEGMSYETITERLSRELKKIAQSEKANIIMVRDFTKHTDSKKNLFQSYGYKLVESLPTSFVEIKWNTFDEYIDSFKSKTKVKMRRNLKRFSSDDLQVQVVDDFRVYVNEMIRLYNNVYEKAENKFEKLNGDFIARLNDNLENDSKAIIVMKDKEVVAIELIVEDSDILRPLYVGIDYKYNEQYRIYFNMIYQIIKLGIEKKKKNVELGQTCYYPKIRAGACVEKMHMYIRFRNSVLNQLFGSLFYIIFKGFKYETEDISD